MSSPADPGQSSLLEWAEGSLWLIVIFWFMTTLGWCVSAWFPGIFWTLAAFATVLSLFAWPFGLALLIISAFRSPRPKIFWWLFMWYFLTAAALTWPIGKTIAPLQVGAA